MHLRSDGSPFYAEVTLTAMVDARRLAAAHAVVRDISARKEAEQALFANRNLLQTLIAAGTLIYVFDTDGRLKLCNLQFETLCGRARETIAGPAPRGVLPLAIAGEHAANDQQVMLSGAQREFEEHMVLDGQPRVFLSIKRPCWKTAW